jgi:hypothetical protein
MNPYNPPKKGGTPNCKDCRWRPICIDPCDDCPNMDVVDENGDLLPGKEYCPYEQHSKKCNKIIAPVCNQFEPSLGSVDLRLNKALDSLR